jgi:hypothetical protein
LSSVHVWDLRFRTGLAYGGSFGFFMNVRSSAHRRRNSSCCSWARTFYDRR